LYTTYSTATCGAMLI